MQKLVFFFPWEEVSGGPFYLCQLADAVAETGKYDVYYTDYYNGLSDTIIKNFNVRKLPYFGNIKKFEIFPKEPIVLVTPIYWFHVVPKLHPDSKILFFNWHNECIPVLQRDWGVNDSVINSMLGLIHKTHSVFFLDKSHQMAQNRGVLKFDDTYVPVTVPNQNILAKQKLINNKEYNIAILGRLCPDKIYGDLDLLRNISELKLGKTVNIHLIGDGTHANEFWSKANFPNLNIISYGTLPLDKVHDVLREKADILFAMGKSVLEGASLALPSVVIPNEVYEFHCDKYSFIFESKGFVMGWGVKQIEELGVKHHTIKEIIEAVYKNKDGKKIIGEKCRTYCLKNHSNNQDLFLSAINKSCFYYKNFVDFIGQPENKESRGDCLKRKAIQLKNRIKIAIGEKYAGLVLFGLPIFVITKRDYSHYNFFLNIIPLFQIEKNGKRTSFHILIVLWILKFFKKVLKRFRRIFVRKTPVVLQTKNEFETVRKRIDKKMNHNKQIKICLFVTSAEDSMHEYIYDLFAHDSRFEPIIIVIPYNKKDNIGIISCVEETYKLLCDKGYRVIKGYDNYSKNYINIKKIINPDVVFYSESSKENLDELYSNFNFENVYSFLTLNDFSMINTRNRELLNSKLQNKVVRYYLPTVIHKGIAQNNMSNGAKNTLVSGVAKYDAIIDKKYIPKLLWKKRDSYKKRVLWMPYYAPEKSANYLSCAFIELYEYMEKLVEQYCDEIQFIFLPHPSLRSTLELIWGKSKTDKYYNFWKSCENTQCESDNIMDLVIGADAVVLDSDWYLSECIYAKKTVFFTHVENDDLVMNMFGTAVMEFVYRNKSTETLKQELDDFIKNIVLKDKDVMKNKRSEFVDKYMVPPNNQLASKNIYDDICKIVIENKFEN